MPKFPFDFDIPEDVDFDARSLRTLTRAIARVQPQRRIRILDDVLDAAANGRKVTISPGGKTTRAITLDPAASTAFCKMVAVSADAAMRERLAKRLGAIVWKERVPLLGEMLSDPDPSIYKIVRKQLMAAHPLFKPVLFDMPGVTGSVLITGEAPAVAVAGPAAQAGTLRRFTDVAFTPAAQKPEGDLTFALRVKSQTGSAHVVDVRVPPGRELVTVLVCACSSVFTVEPALQPIQVPRGKDSEQAIFRISASARDDRSIRTAGQGRRYRPRPVSWSGRSEAGTLLRARARRHRPPDGLESPRPGVVRTALVFINACSAATATLGLAGLTTFGQSFMKAGARAFIGALAPVPTALALEFAEIFFDAYLTRGLPLPAAMFETRRKLAAGPDPTWILYTLYADLSTITSRDAA